jgi:hypothetical protein
MTKRTRDSIGDLGLNRSMLARATHPKLRLEYRTTRDDARREFRVTVRAIRMPFANLGPALRTVAFQRRLLIFGRMTSNKIKNTNNLISPCKYEKKTIKINHTMRISEKPTFQSLSALVVLSFRTTRV